MSCFKILRRIVMMAGDPLKCCPVASECSGRLFSRFQQSVLTFSSDKGGLGGGLFRSQNSYFFNNSFDMQTQW